MEDEVEWSGKRKGKVIEGDGRNDKGRAEDKRRESLWKEWKDKWKNGEQGVEKEM